MTVASVDTSSPPDLSSTIRQIVCEELQRHEEQAHYVAPPFKSSGSGDIVWEPPAAPWRHSVNAADFNGYSDQPPYVTTEPPRNASSVPRFDQHPRSFRP
ncbi:hypothetical protein HPB50_028478 [Hyalomma asiaticum]|nr:hypothetical protein HPB50_028478 [Hyalomma asiaticum]